MSKILPMLMLLTIAFATPVSSQTYSDALMQCYYQSATQEEKTAWVTWSVSNLLLHPRLKDLALSIAPEKRKAVAQEVMIAFERLTLVACRKEAINAMKNEGENSIFRANSLFSGMVTRSYFTDPVVLAGLNESLQFFDKSKFAELGREAGLVGPPK
jgi:hypothetical protein